MGGLDLGGDVHVPAFGFHNLKILLGKNEDEHRVIFMCCCFVNLWNGYCLIMQ